MRTYSGQALSSKFASRPSVWTRFFWSTASMTVLLALWALLSVSLDSRYLPTPYAVFVSFEDACLNGELPFNVSVTLARVAISFVLAMVIGSSIGITLGRNPGLNRFFDGWLILFLNVPALVTIILCYIWFGLNEVTAILAVVVNKVPNVAITMREGARAISTEIQEVAQVFRFSRWKTLRHVIIPQLNPFFAAAARSGLALVWKIVLVVELLGRSNGVGFQLYLQFQLFDVAAILAYSISFIIVVQLIELLILQPWERHINRWRT